MMTTPRKTNMEPENEPLEEEIPIKNPSFSGSMSVFGGDNYFDIMLGCVVIAAFNQLLKDAS